MPTPEDSHRNQKAVLWEVSGVDDYGRRTVSAAEEVMVRWESSTPQPSNPRSNAVHADAIAVVGQAIAVDSIMWLGALDDVADPPVDLMVVVDYSEVPDVKGRKIRRVVQLRRYSDSLPTIA